MKQVTIMIAVLSSFLFCGYGCSKDGIPTQNVNTPNENTDNQMAGKVNITVANTVFTATLYDNATVEAFKALLPLTVEMSELNANEKYYYLDATLPTNAAPGGTIHPGDLMLYGNNCFVLFYEGLNTSYSYTRLGKVDDISGLKQALGTGIITVTVQLQ